MFTELDVQPSRSEDVVQSDPCGLETNRPLTWVDGWNKKETDVLGESAAGKDVDAGKVEAIRREMPVDRSACRVTRNRILRHATCAFIMPMRRDTHGDWPVRRVLINGGVAIVHQLVAVIAKVLPETIQLRPCFVTSRT